MANIIEIHDFSDPALDVYARLTENQLLNRADSDNALFVAESPLVIGRALDAGCEPMSFLMERQHIKGKGREILVRCCQDIPVYTADESVLTQLTGFHLTRGMLCAMRRPKLPSVEDVCGASSCLKT
jgi:tRNA G18 (ribose-2'-O)-methylase SpoU